MSSVPCPIFDPGRLSCRQVKLRPCGRLQRMRFRHRCLNRLQRLRDSPRQDIGPKIFELRFGVLLSCFFSSAIPVHAAFIIFPPGSLFILMQFLGCKDSGAPRRPRKKHTCIQGLRDQAASLQDRHWPRKSYFFFPMIALRCSSPHSNMAFTTFSNARPDFVNSYSTLTGIVS